ncbi:ROK family protein, partial [Mesorhizobium sp. M4A.F.Ca.ET.050.02.1.1]
AEEGNAAAAGIIAGAVVALVDAFADLTASADIDCFAVGGGVGLAGGFIEALQARSLDLPRVYRRPIVAARAGADAGLLGAAMLARSTKSDGNFHRI